MKKTFNEGDGVWRTIGGRRIFIREGQALSDAMKKSGKFGSHKKMTEDKLKQGRKSLAKSYSDDELNEEINSYKDKTDDFSKKRMSELESERDSRKVSDLENSKALEDRVEQVRAENEKYRNSLNKTDYSQEKLDQVYKTEDYTEVINHLSASELRKMNQAAHDMNTTSPDSPAYKNAKDYLTEMENKAAGKYLDSEAKKRDAFNKKQESKSTITDDIRVKVAESSKGAMMETYTKDIRDASGLKVTKSFETDLYGNGKEDRFELEDGRWISHTTESLGKKDDTWTINKLEKGSVQSQKYDSYNDMIEKLSGSDKKSSSNTAYKKAFEEYKKMHPKSKLTLQQFIDFSEGK